MKEGPVATEVRDVPCEGCGKKIAERREPGRRGVDIKCKHCGVVTEV